MTPRRFSVVYKGVERRVTASTLMRLQRMHDAHSRYLCAPCGRDFISTPVAKCDETPDACRMRQLRST